MAEVGEDVQAQLAAVAVEGHGPELAGLAWQPGAFDVGGQGEAAATCAAALEFLIGEPPCQRFGFGSVGAGGMPPAAFLAGGGVEALVDDDVPVVALGG